MSCPMHTHSVGKSDEKGLGKVPCQTLRIAAERMADPEARPVFAPALGQRRASNAAIRDDIWSRKNLMIPCGVR